MLTDTENGKTAKEQVIDFFSVIIAYLHNFGALLGLPKLLDDTQTST